MMAKIEYVVVTNIPFHFHASDLRAHFSSFVENNSFTCFHFRHRPEKMTQSNDINEGFPQEIVPGRSEDSHEFELDANKRTTCCVIRVLSSICKEFINKYNEQQWTDVYGEYLANMCHLSAIKVRKDKDFHHNSNNEEMMSEIENRNVVDEKDLLSMPELRPPELMPNGNVGTPTLIFLDLIQRCLLPNSIINKLHLKFPSTSAKRLYSNVNFEYTDNHNLKRQRHNQNVNFDKPYHLKCSALRKGIFTAKKRSGSQSEVSSDSNSTAGNPCSSSTSGEVVKNSHVKNSKGKKLSEIYGVVEASSSSSSQMLSSSTSTLSTESKICASESQTLESSSILEDANHLKCMLVSKNRPLTAREKKQLAKEDRRRTRALMDEGIEEHLIQIEKRYRNDDDAEEWDRHEASEDDPSNQERNKERLYEEEIEQPWEKGGPGVVFYTDAMYWQAKEGDFDEQTTDDLDVDFSPYEGDGRGDKDIQDFLKIRQEKRFRSGYDKTDRFSIGLSKRPGSSLMLPPPILAPRPKKRQSTSGEFERHTKGIGRKLMEEQGWQEGQGLGRTGSGIREALRGDGQTSRIKKGLGYVDSEPTKYGPSVLKKVRLFKPPVQHLITTSKDDPGLTDPKEPLLTRNEATHLKHRRSFLESHKK